MIAIIHKLKLQCPKCGYKNDLNDMINAGFYNKCLMCGHEEMSKEDRPKDLIGHISEGSMSQSRWKKNRRKAFIGVTLLLVSCILQVVTLFLA